MSPSPASPLAGRRVLVLVSGSIAAVKIPLVVSTLVQKGAQVRCVLTPAATALASASALATLSRAPCHLDGDQWSHRASRPLHIELAEWAEVVLMAPLSATTLARWVHGLADTLVAGVLQACEAPVLAAPAMNSAMWSAAAVRRNREVLSAMPAVLTLEPGQGLLACDRVGDGRMAEPDRLVLALESLLLHGPQRDWQGLRLLVTAGPTREDLDPARCLTNRSSGRMGVMLAQAASLRGARVDLIHGPLQVPSTLLEGLTCHPIESAADLERTLADLGDRADAIAMAAAVADHRLAEPLADKLPKDELDRHLRGDWQTVPDLLAALVRRRPPGQVILGFAAHSGEVLPQARLKLARKGCDLLFANPIDRPGAGFASETNQGWLLGPGNGETWIPDGSKLALAHQLLSALGDGLATARLRGEAPSHTGC